MSTLFLIINKKVCQVKSYIYQFLCNHVNQLIIIRRILQLNQMKLKNIAQQFIIFHESLGIEDREDVTVGLYNAAWWTEKKDNLQFGAGSVRKEGLITAQSTHWIAIFFNLRKNA